MGGLLGTPAARTIPGSSPALEKCSCHHSSIGCMAIHTQEDTSLVSVSNSLERTPSGGSLDPQPLAVPRFQAPAHLKGEKDKHPRLRTSGTQPWNQSGQSRPSWVYGLFAPGPMPLGFYSSSLASVDKGQLFLQFLSITAASDAEPGSRDPKRLSLGAWPQNTILAPVLKCQWEQKVQSRSEC